MKRINIKEGNTGIKEEKSWLKSEKGITRCANCVNCETAQRVLPLLRPRDCQFSCSCKTWPRGTRETWTAPVIRHHCTMRNCSRRQSCVSNVIPSQWLWSECKHMTWKQGRYISVHAVQAMAHAFLQHDTRCNLKTARQGCDSSGHERMSEG
jgi:hypothetical protein